MLHAINCLVRLSAERRGQQVNPRWKLDVEIRGAAQRARVVRTPFYPSKAKKS